MKYVRMEMSPENVAIITLDNPGSPLNTVTLDLLREMAGSLEGLVESGARGLVIVSGKTDSFVAGADLEELRNMSDREQIEKYVATASKVSTALRGLPMPVVAAVHGSCLGAGLELALACSYRMATECPCTVFGFPELTLGLIPPAGGGHLLSRLIGIRNALSLILTGRQVRAKQAKKLGIIDEVVPEHGLKAMALQRTLSLPQKIRRKSNISLSNRVLDSNPAGRALLFSRAKKAVLKKTAGNYPAPVEVIKSMAEGYRRGIPRAVVSDASRFAGLALSPQSRALVGVCFGIQAQEKAPRAVQALPVKKLAVIGAGLMGRGIVSVSAKACDTILLKDRNLDSVADGMKDVWINLDRERDRGALSRFERDVRYGKIVPCDDYQFFTGTDFVIEAVFEELELKRRILNEIEESTGAHCIFASNTSAIPISEIAKKARRPENVIGMHYFSPVQRMPLLEIIRTDRTSKKTLAAALSLGAMQGKTCIVVKDGPGFYTTRILAPFLMEAGLLVSQGVRVSVVDSALREFGYPVGPLALIDEIGLDVALRVSGLMEPLFSPRGIKESGQLDALVKKGYLGRKSGKGLYCYDTSKKRGSLQENEEVCRTIQEEGGEINKDEIIERVTLMMVNEAVRCLEEGIIPSPEAGDLGAVLGLGFPPFRGGPFGYIDSEGARIVVEALEKRTSENGPRFTPAALLVETAKRGKRFRS